MKRAIQIVVYSLEWREAGRCCVGGSRHRTGRQMEGLLLRLNFTSITGRRVHLVTPKVLFLFSARWQSELQPASQTLWMHRRELRNSARNTGTSSRHSGSSPCEFLFSLLLSSECPPKANQVVKQSKQSQGGWRLRCAKHPLHRDFGFHVLELSREILSWQKNCY